MGDYFWVYGFKWQFAFTFGVTENVFLIYTCVHIPHLFPITLSQIALLCEVSCTTTFYERNVDSLWLLTTKWIWNEKPKYIDTYHMFVVIHFHCHLHFRKHHVKVRFSIHPVGSLSLEKLDRFWNLCGHTIMAKAKGYVRNFWMPWKPSKWTWIKRIEKTTLLSICQIQGKCACILPYVYHVITQFSFKSMWNHNCQPMNRNIKTIFHHETINHIFGLRMVSYIKESYIKEYFPIYIDEFITTRGFFFILSFRWPFLYWVPNVIMCYTHSFDAFNGLLFLWSHLITIMASCIPCSHWVTYKAYMSLFEFVISHVL